MLRFNVQHGKRFTQVCLGIVLDDPLSLVSDGVKTDKIRRFENHRPQKLNAASTRQQLVVRPNEF